MASGLDQLEERRIVEVANAHPRVGAAAEEGLVLPDVSDPSHYGLIHQRIADGQVCPERVAKKGEGEVRVERVIEQVGAQHRNRSVVLERAELQQLDDGGTEVHYHSVVDFEDEAGLPRRALPRFSRPVHVPRAVHAQVATQGEAVVKGDDEILAPRPGPSARRTDNPLNGRDGAGPLRTGRTDGLPPERPVDPGCESKQRITLGHGDHPGEVGT